MCFTRKAHRFVFATFQVLNSHMGLMAARVDRQVQISGLRSDRSYPTHTRHSRPKPVVTKHDVLLPDAVACLLLGSDKCAGLIITGFQSAHSPSTLAAKLQLQNPSLDGFRVNVFALPLFQK